MPGLGGRLKNLIQQFENASTSADKGTRYEALATEFLNGIPGITVTRQRVLNAAGSQEIDLAGYNTQKANGAPFLPYFFFAEAKGWQSPVGSHEIAWFSSKLTASNLTHGLLFTAVGITGDPNDRTAARNQLAVSLQQGRHIIVITKNDLLSVRYPRDAVNLIRDRMLQLFLGRLDL